jgi:predicted O-methyltransferase YrrM
MCARCASQHQRRWPPPTVRAGPDDTLLASVIKSKLYRRRRPMSCKTAFPDGHFYSPVVDPAELEGRDLWSAAPEVLGIDFNDASHQQILTEAFPRHIAEYRYEEEAPSEDAELDRFYTRNSQFGWLDSRALFVLLCEWRPRRIIEVGSGYSSLLMADVNQRLLGNECTVTCIEPYPRPFLRRKLPGLSEVIEQKVQEVALSRFEALQPGDILFIDSSHVAKTGSDVNYLFFDVLPRLNAGVRIHVHDIFLPLEYPKEWVIDDNRSWNEQYLLRALLMYSSGFRVLFGSSYAFHRFPDEVKRALALPDGHAFGGGSIWLERIA